MFLPIPHNFLRDIEWLIPTFELEQIQVFKMISLKLTLVFLVFLLFIINVTVISIINIGDLKKKVFSIHWGEYHVS